MVERCLRVRPQHLADGRQPRPKHLLREILAIGPWAGIPRWMTLLISVGKYLAHIDRMFELEMGPDGGKFYDRSPVEKPPGHHRDRQRRSISGKISRSFLRMPPFIGDAEQGHYDRGNDEFVAHQHNGGGEDCKRCCTGPNRSEERRVGKECRSR